MAKKGTNMVEHSKGASMSNNEPDIFQQLRNLLDIQAVAVQARIDLFVAMEPHFIERFEAMIKYATHEPCSDKNCAGDTIPRDRDDWGAIKNFIHNVYNYYMESARHADVLAFQAVQRSETIKGDALATVAKSMCEREACRLAISLHFARESWSMSPDSKMKRATIEQYGFDATQFLSELHKRKYEAHEEMKAAVEVRNNMEMERARHATKQ